MNFKRIIDDYIECNNFEIKFKDEKIKIYYYDSIKSITNDKIVVKSSSKIVEVIGDNLAIETMFKEFLIIKGSIKKIILV